MTAAIDLPAAPPREVRRGALPLIAEAAAVVVGAVAVTCWAFRDALSGLSTTVPGDLGDPLYFAWQLAWVRHALVHDPAGLWTTPDFLQAPDNLAFTDTVLGYAPLGIFVPEGMAGAITLLNISTIAAGALAIVGAYALARAMGAGRLAAVVAGVGFGFAPWRLAQVTHINVISTGGIALALALLARGTGWSLRRGWEPDRMSWRWILAGWLVACYQLTFGFAIGIWFVHTLGAVMALWCLGWLLFGRRRARPPRSTVIAHLVGGALFAATTALLLRPYFRVLDAHPEARRGEEWLPLFAPPWRGLLTAPSTSWFWGDRQVEWRKSLTWQGEMTVSPGIVLLVLAVAGVLFSVYPWRRRIGLVLTTAALTVLTMGTAFPLGNGEWTYLLLYRYVPGWSALRTTGRLIVWVSLALCVLAAGAIERFRVELAPRRAARGYAADGYGADGYGDPDGGYGRRRRGLTVGGVAAALFAIVPAVVVVGEGLNVVPHWTVGQAPVTLRALDQPVLVLPSEAVGDYAVMLWATDGWPALANGSSGFETVAQEAMRKDAATFPDAASIEALRRRGIRTVVLVRSRIRADQPWSGAPDRSVDGLGIKRADLGDGVVYDLYP